MKDVTFYGQLITLLASLDDTTEAQMPLGFIRRGLVTQLLEESRARLPVVARIEAGTASRFELCEVDEEKKGDV